MRYLGLTVGVFAVVILPALAGCDFMLGIDRRYLPLPVRGIYENGLFRPCGLPLKYRVTMTDHAAATFYKMRHDLSLSEHDPVLVVFYAYAFAEDKSETGVDGRLSVGSIVDMRAGRCEEEPTP